MVKSKMKVKFTFGVKTDIRRLILKAEVPFLVKARDKAKVIVNIGVTQNVKVKEKYD